LGFAGKIQTLLGESDGVAHGLFDRNEVRTAVGLEQRNELATERGQPSARHSRPRP
jgi:hypothetical protein